MRNEDLNYQYVTERLFMASGRHSSLRSKATTFVGSKRGYLWLLAATAHCGQRIQYFWGNKEAIYSHDIR